VEAGAGSKQRTRRIASLVLLITGTVILFVGGITLYLRQEVFDADSFAAHASESLGDDRVGLAVANPITDEVIANGPDQLIHARPVVESGVQGVIESRPFRDLFQDAAARAHRTLFSRDRDELILNLADTGAFVIDAVKSISPQIAKQIPKDIKPGLIEVTRSNFAIGAVQFGESIRFLGLFLPALGILMLVGSVAVAVERRGALIRVSAAVAIAAALGFIALLVGRSILLAPFDDDLVHDAVEAAWSSYLGGLQAWFLGLGIAAIALAAAASTAGEVDIDARDRGFRDRVERIPETPARRALRIRDQFGKGAVKRVEAIGERVAGADSGGEQGTYLCHVACELGATELTQALTDVRKFLDTHPDEFLIVVIEDYVAPEDIRTAFEDSGLVRYAYVHERDAPFPTLRELIRADKRILVMAENDNGGGSIPWYHDGFELMQETPYTFGSADELRDPKSCKPNRGTAHSPLFQFNHWVEKLPRSPDLGERVNAYDFLLERARECRRQRGLAPNLIAVDFYDEGDVLEARKLNRLPRDAEPQVRETS
jgi:hypothetical protein